MSLNRVEGVPKISNDTMIEMLNFSDLLKTMPAPKKADTDWLGSEYEKHIQGVRDRYPLLSKLLLRGNARDNANLSDIDTTNKYARLADAYNAQMRYVAGDWQSGGKAGEGSERVGMGHYEQVPHLETQDQKQMDQLRQAQADMRKYELDEESHFQRDYETRKMDEMTKIMEQDYQQQFFNANEQMRRISSMFDMWKEMDLEEFRNVLKEIGIPATYSKEILERLKDNNYMEAAFMLQKSGLTIPAADQIAKMALSTNIISKVANNPNMDAREVAMELGQLDGEFMIEKIHGALEAAKQTKGGLGEAARAAEKLLVQLTELGSWTAENIKDIASTAAGATLIAAALPFIVGIFIK
jgi:hypothetical protein